MEYIQNTLLNLLQQTAFLNLTGGNLIMIAVACVFLHLAINKGFEPRKPDHDLSCVYLPLPCDRKRI